MLMCERCRKQFPTKVRIDGVKRNIQNRKYCLDCSPFGDHNTRQLTGPRKKPDGTCRNCGKPVKGRNRGKCYNCYQRDKIARSRKRVHDIVGTSCWKCGFDIGLETIGVMDFHHMQKKSFNLMSRNIGNKSWQRVITEVRKCCLLCCRCHRLVHYGVITQEEISQIYERRWAEIEGSKLAEQAA